MNKKGFTLIELAIVLAVVGVMSVGGVIAVTKAFENTKFISSRSQIESIVKEIAEFSAQGQYIPDTASLSDVVYPLNDSFEKPVLYIPSPALTSPDSICNATATGLSINECANAACTSVTDTITNAAFAVISGSVNKNIQADDSNPSVIEIYSEDVTVDGHPADVDNSEKYDDIIGWLTLDALKVSAGCYGSPIKIIDSKIPKAYFESSYDYDIFADGGSGAYQWCVESSDSAVRNLFSFDGTSLQSDCTGNYTAGGQSVNISSADLTGTLPETSKVKVYLQDSNGAQAVREYSLNIIQPYQLVLDRSGGGLTPDDKVNSSSLEYYYAPTPDETTNINTNQGMASVNLDPNGDGDYSDAVLTFERYQNTEGSACVWFADETGVDFKDRKFAVYFEYTPKTASSGPTDNALKGFTFIMQNSHRVDSSGLTVNTIYDCGDKNAGLGYAGDDTYSVSPLKGETFAIEFDANYEAQKNDPFYTQGNGPNRFRSLQHMAVVSFIEGLNPGDEPVAYNVHGSEENDACTTTPGSGCYVTDLYEQNKLFGVRMEAYYGCSSTGSICGNYSPVNNNICVYGWFKKASDSISDEMKDTDVFHKNTSASVPPVPLGEPQIKDCYPVSEGSMERIRYGYSVSADFKNYVIDIGNIKTHIEDY